MDQAETAQKNHEPGAPFFTKQRMGSEPPPNPEATHQPGAPFFAKQRVGSEPPPNPQNILTRHPRLTATLTTLVALWLCFIAFIGWAMRQPPETFGRVMSHMPTPAYFLFPFETMWTQARAGHLPVGATAPDLPLLTLADKTPLQLATLWSQKPVVLVFGSYT